MSYRQIVLGETEPYEVEVVDSADAPLTGKTDIKLRIRRKGTSPVQYLDWADMTFKTSGWTTLDKALTEVGSLGVYELIGGFDSSAIVTVLASTENLIFEAVQVSGSDAANLPAYAELQVRPPASLFEEGAVWVDLTNGVAGTKFPIGTAGTPVSNLPDAKTIADANNLKRIFFTTETTQTVTMAQGFAGFEFRGLGENMPRIDLGGQAVDRCRFEQLGLQGTGTGFVTADDCLLSGFPTALDVSGTFQRCWLLGTLKPGSSGVTLLDCTGRAKVGAVPVESIVDFVNGVGSLFAHDMKGGLTIKNNSSSRASFVTGNALELLIDATVSTGETVIAGDIFLTDSKTGTATLVDRRNAIADLDFIEAIEGGRQEITDLNDGTLSCYKDDNVTEIARFALFDKNGLRTTGLPQFGDQARAVAERTRIPIP